jgi:hypothetical protein
LKTPPAWAPGLLTLALPTAIALEILALVVATLVFPVGDLMPLFVLAVAILSRRWAGVATKWFAGASVLAVLLLIEWVARDVWYYTQVFEGSMSNYAYDQLMRQFGTLAMVLALVQIVALLVVFGRACSLSNQGVKRARGEG